IAKENVLRQLLDIIDDFDRAMTAMEAQKKTSETESMQQGIQLIYDKFMHLLQQSGVKPMDLKEGSEFDADLHEAVTQIRAEEALKGKTVDSIEKGYYLKDQVLRLAKIVIGV